MSLLLPCTESLLHISAYGVHSNTAILFLSKHIHAQVMNKVTRTETKGTRFSFSYYFMYVIEGKYISPKVESMLLRACRCSDML